MYVYIYMDVYIYMYIYKLTLNQGALGERMGQTIENRMEWIGHYASRPPRRALVYTILGLTRYILNIVYL